MPNALASVLVQTIQKWEYWMQQWVKACEGSLDAKDAQKVVTEFSLKKYASH